MEERLLARLAAFHTYATPRKGMDMSNAINIRNNFADVAERLDRMAVDAGNKAMVRALNATVEQGKIQMARQISQEFRISVSDAKGRLSVDKASVRGELRFHAKLEATKKGKGRSMNLISFAEKTVTMAQAQRRMIGGEGGMHLLRNGAQVQKVLQLRFQIKRGGGKKVIQGAFLGNDGRTVFIRTGKGRLPIKALNTIDVPQMFNTKRINSVVRTVIVEKFGANFNRELRAVLKGYAR